MSFQDLDLHAKILKVIDESGYKEPTSIQMQAIPAVLEGKDLCACSHTGSGKTAAFMLPSLTKLLRVPTKKNRAPRVLVLVPTRELAIQVTAQAHKYSKYLPKVKTVCVYGGVPYPVQKRQLSKRYEILVATPGRLIDHLGKGLIDFSDLELLILDEADRMLDMGFIDPVEKIAQATPKTRQTVLFSATLDHAILKLSKNLLSDPLTIRVSDNPVKHENIEQSLLRVDNIGHKHELLDHLLQDTSLNQTIIFTATKFQARQLREKLADQGHDAAELHGDINQNKRTKTIKKFRDKRTRILVATDVAARGIDIDSVGHVINFDFPQQAEDYVHRIGRTGRAGAKGTAFSFAANKDMRTVKQTEDYIKQKINPISIPGLEAKSKPSSNPFEKKKPRSGGKRKFYKRRENNNSSSFKSKKSRRPRSR